VTVFIVYLSSGFSGKTTDVALSEDASGKKN